MANAAQKRYAKNQLLKLISEGELSIPSLAYTTKVEELFVQDCIKEFIATGFIFAELSSDGLSIIPKNPKKLYVVRESPEVTPEIDVRLDANSMLITFWVSAFLSILGVGIFAIMLIALPVLPIRTVTPVEMSGDNFFFQWSYTYNYSIDQYWLNSIKPSIGFFALMSIAVISLPISGFGLLLRDKKNLRNLILLNWGLYLVPIILSVIISAQVLFNGYMEITHGYYSTTTHYTTIGLEYSAMLGVLYFSPFIFVQSSMFNERKLFVEWANFSDKENNIKITRSPGRIANAIIFLLIAFWMWFYPIALMLDLSKTALLSAHMSLLLILLIWWLFIEGIRVQNQRSHKVQLIKSILNQGVTNLAGIASQLQMPREDLERIANTLIENNSLEATLSADGTELLPYAKFSKTKCSSCRRTIDDDSKYCSYCGEKLDDSLIISLRKNREVIEKSDLHRYSKKKLFGLFSLLIALFSIATYIYMLIKWESMFYALLLVLAFMYIGIILGNYSSGYAIGLAGYLINALGILIVPICLFIILTNIM